MPSVVPTAVPPVGRKNRAELVFERGAAASVRISAVRVRAVSDPDLRRRCRDRDQNDRRISAAVRNSTQKAGGPAIRRPAHDESRDMASQAPGMRFPVPETQFQVVSSLGFRGSAVPCAPRWAGTDAQRPRRGETRRGRPRSRESGESDEERCRKDRAWAGGDQQRRPAGIGAPQGAHRPVPRPAGGSADRPGTRRSGSVS